MVTNLASIEHTSSWCFGDMVVFVLSCNKNPFVPKIKGIQGKIFTIRANPNHVRNHFLHNLMSSCEFLHSHCMISVEPPPPPPPSPIIFLMLEQIFKCIIVNLKVTCVENSHELNFFNQAHCFWV